MNKMINHIMQKLKRKELWKIEIKHDASVFLYGYC